jgi:hypothetical protein
MTKPVIVTREGKGSPLTRAELDANFSNIDNATIGVSDGTNSGSLNLNDTLNFAASGSATVAFNSATKTVTVGATGGGGGGDKMVFLAWAYTQNGDNLVYEDSARTLFNYNGIVTFGIDSTVGRWQINGSGTYMIEVEGQMQSNVSDTNIQIWDVTLGDQIGQQQGANMIVKNSSGQDRYLVPNLKRITTVTGTRVFEIKVANANSNNGGILAGQKYLKITKLS